jgi:hypothetical protein
MAKQKNELENPEAARALQIVQQLDTFREENSISRLTVSFSEDGSVTSIEEAVVNMPPASSGMKQDVVVFCPRKQKKCVATFEVQRALDGKVEWCCSECVGPARENIYQKML